jgi:dTDP-N-acetylfucosamine:lipid II N-acetylfucosaminyltransferase
MSNLRILHLSIDDKFVDHALLLFEKAFPGQNDVMILAKSQKLEFVKLTPKRIVQVSRFDQRIPKIDESEYENYDLVIFHSFDDMLYPEVFNIRQGIPAVWLGWGYDYYDLFTDSRELLLPQTRAAERQLKKISIRSTARIILRFLLNSLKVSKSRIKSIEKLSVFSPVLPSEYYRVCNARNWKKFPEKAQWNYGTIEDNFIKGFEGEQVEGNSILVGNSSSVTCNHLDVFTLLDKIDLTNRKIVVPLSYGDKDYGQKILKVGKDYFGKNFDPLTEFMPIKDYVATIKKCGYVIMNQKRQQAVGNIVIMLYLGARVFIRDESLTYSFLKEMGVSLSSVQELETNPALLSTPLTAEERQKNRRLVSDYWSRERAIERTKSLVRQALALKGVTKKNRAYGELTG